MLSCSRVYLTALLVVVLLANGSVHALKKKVENEKPEKGKDKINKNIMDYSEADMQRLLDQWVENDDNEDDEDKYDDNDPRKPQPKVPQFDPSKIKDDPMAFVKMAKKGKTIMMFVSVAGHPSKKRTEEISQRWQTSLHNAHQEVTRYIVADDRVLYLMKDGSIAWDVKDFLLTQPECASVEFDNQKFVGAGGKPTDSAKKKSEL